MNIICNSCDLISSKNYENPPFIWLSQHTLAAIGGQQLDVHFVQGFQDVLK